MAGIVCLKVPQSQLALAEDRTMSTKAMIIAAAVIVLLSAVMVYLYGEHFASEDAAPTATSQPDRNNSSTIQDY